MKLTTKDTMTSLEVLEQINLFREKEDKSELAHGDLLKIIRIEFGEEISQGKISLSNNIVRGREYPMFILNLSQAKQILLRESLYVRKAVIKYIEELEETIRLILENKLDKKQQLEAMKKFGGLLPEIEAQESLPYVKINTCVNKAVSNYFGFPKMLKKDDMSSDMLIKRNEVMQRFLVAYELFKDITKAKEFIYEEFKQPTIEFAGDKD